MAERLSSLGGGGNGSGRGLSQVAVGALGDRARARGATGNNADVVADSDTAAVIASLRDALREKEAEFKEAQKDLLERGERIDELEQQLDREDTTDYSLMALRMSEHLNTLFLPTVIKAVTDSMREREAMAAAPKISAGLTSMLREVAQEVGIWSAFGKKACKDDLVAEILRRLNDQWALLVPSNSQARSDCTNADGTKSVVKMTAYATKLAAEQIVGANKVSKSLYTVAAEARNKDQNDCFKQAVMEDMLESFKYNATFKRAEDIGDQEACDEIAAEMVSKKRHRDETDISEAGFEAIISKLSAGA
ncbi:hypothetical protein H0W26_01895 [Candidatus Dependentiae bacterium]|nr:hypothetical protein [Candidatus Dependentiae bacterium]